MNSEGPKETRKMAHPGQSPTDMAALRHKLATYIAQHITFSLINAGASPELHAQISRLVNDKLARDSIELPSDVRTQLIEDILQHLGKPHLLAPATEAEEGAWTVEKLRARVAPYLASNLTNADFEAGHELRLALSTCRLIEEKLTSDKIAIDAALKLELMKTCCGVMGVEIPPVILNTLSESSESPPVAPPPPVATSSPPVSLPVKPAPVSPPSTSTAAKPPAPPIPAASSVPATHAPTSLQPPDDEHWRGFVLELGMALDPEIMAGSDPTARRAHVRAKADEILGRQGVRLLPSQVESIIESILSGSGMSFQL